MQVRQLTNKDYGRMPWKNGQGSTMQLISDPGLGGGFNWRLSIADVGQSGPFSDFAGYDRVITLIEGNGMILTFNGSMERHVTRPFEPLPFNGGWQTDCRLIDGPLRDFNLMVARSWGHGSMTVLHPRAGEKCEIGESPVTLLHVFNGKADLEVGTSKFSLAPGDTLHLDAAPDGLLLAGTDADVAAIYLEPKG
jgi:hypothetical protein